MNKKGKWVLWVSIALVVVLVIGMFFYFAMFSPQNERAYADSEVKNPSVGLTTEEAVMQFDESFVFYILYSIKAYNLHNPPLSSNTPKIEFLIDDESFNAEIVDGAINVKKGIIADEDIIIRTTKEEGVKMTQSKDYVQESFSSGKSGIELVAGKVNLFSKGYLNMYTELTGKSVTGNVIRIYAN